MQNRLVCYLAIGGFIIGSALIGCGAPAVTSSVQERKTMKPNLGHRLVASMEGARTVEYLYPWDGLEENLKGSGLQLRHPGVWG